ncbi:hypothetical protein VE03_00287 [Pseudogymnoascus sp. 23342-1-I1]|nr:hypothetical protein VE03_00287 [Pseudogymnoascus sp. 23342-1-I1]
MNDPAPAPAPIPSPPPPSPPAPSTLSTPILQIPLSLTPTQMSLARHQLFDITRAPLTLPITRFLTLWPWIDNVYVRKKTRAATGRKPGYELWECRNRRKHHPPTAPVTPRPRVGRPGATCLVSLKIIWDRQVVGEERTVTIERYTEETHSHTLDDMDRQKRSSALRRLAAREALKGAQPHEVANAMKAEMEALDAVGGRYITRADVKNAMRSYEGGNVGAAGKWERGQEGEGPLLGDIEGAEMWHKQLLSGPAPWMESPTQASAQRREPPAPAPAPATAPINAPQTQAPPPTQAPPSTNDPNPLQAPSPAPSSPPPVPLSATTLLLIDSQAGFTHPTHWGPARSNPSYETNIATLLSHFRALRLAHPGAGPDIIHVRHASADPTSPLHPDAAGFAWMPYTTPIAGEAIVTKGVNSSFIGTDLEEMLRARGTRRLYVAGLSTDHCVSTTVRMAGNLGVTDGEWGRGEVVLVGDATACWEKVGGGWKAEIVHAVHVESLREFARVGWTGEVVRECVG